MTTIAPFHHISTPMHQPLSLVPRGFQPFNAFGESMYAWGLIAVW